MIYTIGIVVVCTNAYFVLGIRFIKKFMHHYKGTHNIVFYIYSDTDPREYLSEKINFRYHHCSHKTWRDGTNSKFNNIIMLDTEPLDYIYYFDADTNIGRPFDESWFIGDLVAGEHYGNSSYMIDVTQKPFERNKISKAYVPINSDLPQTYCYGAFFGGKKDNVISMCKVLSENQKIDTTINFEPCWNDESYLNQYFHYNNPKIIPSKDFAFMVSDKGGVGETRNTNLDIENIKTTIRNSSSSIFDIVNGNVVIYE